MSARTQNLGLVALALGGSLSLAYAMTGCKEMGSAHASSALDISDGRPLFALADTGSAAPAIVESGAPDAEVKPSDTLANPAEDPIEAWSDIKAAKKVGWVALAFAVVTMLAMGIGTAAKKWGVKRLEWLNRGRAAIVVGGVAAVGAACFDAAMNGGSLVALGLAAWTAFLAYWQKASA